jgi:hypothetical protein
VNLIVVYFVFKGDLISYSLFGINSFSFNKFASHKNALLYYYQ